MDPIAPIGICLLVSSLVFLCASAHWKLSDLDTKCRERDAFRSAEIQRIRERGVFAERATSLPWAPEGDKLRSCMTHIAREEIEKDKSAQRLRAQAKEKADDLADLADAVLSGKLSKADRERVANVLTERAIETTVKVTA